jgi:beta-glucanase (GH16 family)
MKNTSFLSSVCLIVLHVWVLCSSCQREPASARQNLLIPETAMAGPSQAAATTTATAVCDYDINEASLIAAGWTKKFEDNFTAGLSKWNIWTGGAFNNELQYYQAASLQVANGNLVISVKKETVTGAATPYDATPKTFSYTSGRIECKSIVSASAPTPKVRMIARIKLPGGYGMWPAFWSYGNPWPTKGEIDCLEARGQEPYQYQTNYFYGKVANNNLVSNASGYITASADLTACYHVYEMIWTKNNLTSYLDGQLVDNKSGGYIPDLFGKKEFITLNVAVGGNFFSNFDPDQIQTGTMYVDYVKVFTSK